MEGRFPKNRVDRELRVVDVQVVDGVVDEVVDVQVVEEVVDGTFPERVVDGWFPDVPGMSCGCGCGCGWMLWKLVLEPGGVGRGGHPVASQLNPTGLGEAQLRYDDHHRPRRPRSGIHSPRRTSCTALTCSSCRVSMRCSPQEIQLHDQKGETTSS